MQQKCVGSRIVGLSKNVSMGWYWSDFQKKCRISKLSDYRIFSVSTIFGLQPNMFSTKSTINYEKFHQNFLATKNANDEKFYEQKKDLSTII